MEFINYSNYVFLFLQFCNGVVEFPFIQRLLKPDQKWIIKVHFVQEGLMSHNYVVRMSTSNVFFTSQPVLEWNLTGKI